MNHDACKFILSCLVHKDNKDITTRPKYQLPGHSCVEARERKEKALEGKRAAAKADPPVEKYGDVDHQLKKVLSGGVAIIGCKELCGCNKDACGCSQGADQNNAAVGERLHLEDGIVQVGRYDCFADESDAWDGAFHQHFRDSGVSK